MELKKGSKVYLPLAVFDDYSMTKTEIDAAMRENPSDWDEEVLFEVQIVRKLVGNVTVTATLKEA